MSGTSTATSGRRVRRLILVSGTVGLLVLGGAVAAMGQRGGDDRGGDERGGGQIQLPTTHNDFFQPGTQPNPNSMEFDPILTSQSCVSCHGNYLGDESDAEPWDAWVASMMGQSTRDPIWHAARSIANQDAHGAGEYCIRCHAPKPWLAGKSGPGDTSNFDAQDFDGVNCNFCHRAVDPNYQKGVSPIEDESILADLMFPPDPNHHGNARYIVDPNDSRRGPFDDIPFNMHDPVPIIVSPLHQTSEMCATCHDVSNPVFERDPKTGNLVVGALDTEHNTQNPDDMFGEQRTYSEWLNSQFADGGVYFADGRFGGNHPTGVMESCQDCHMPDVFTGGCFLWENEPFFAREDMPMHSFAGANTWVLSAVFEKYGFDSGLTPTRVASAQARVVQMLRAASDLDLDQCGNEIRARVTNWSGHKLPTGYPEGRRMWLNVQFLDDDDNIVAERGSYDTDTAELTTGDTKVYEAVHTISDDIAEATNLPYNAHFHLALNNVIEFDNRIPPVGFENDAFEAIQAAPVGYTYEDGQHWDDTFYAIPKGATKAVVTLYYQTTSKEYIEFLRDANVTDTNGQEAYDLWVSNGKSAPVDMDVKVINLSMPLVGDVNGDGSVNVDDLLLLLAAWGPCSSGAGCDCPADITGNGVVDVDDLLAMLANWGG